MLNMRLKELRKKSKITQEQLAKIIGVERSSIGKYESPNKPVIPSTDIIMRIADYFGVTTDYLMGREEKTAPLEPSLTEKQQLILDLAEQLSDEDAKKLIDYAKLLKKANNQ